MLTSLIRYIKGYVKIQIISYSPERFINACKHRKINLWELQYKNGSYEMYITIKGFKKLKPVIRKTGTKVIVIKRFGLPFFFYKYRKRKIFLIGAIGSVFCVYLLSLFIWDIEFSGNISYSDETLIKYLKEKQIYHGMKKDNLDCSEIVKEIRKNYNDIIWVSASIEGTRLLIQVKENETLEQEKNLNNKKNEDSKIGYDIVSTQDCIIKEIITRKGMPLVSEETKVNKGDLLVTGMVEILNDNNEKTAYLIEQADADIRGEIQYRYENQKEKYYEEKVYYGQCKEEIFLRIKNRLFWIGSRKNVHKESESRLIEKQICIGNHFKLPIWYGNKKTRPYRSKMKKYTENDLQTILTDDFRKYCDELEKKGVEILENNVKIYTERNFAVAKGTLTIICDIGEKREIIVPEVPMEDELNGND